jgi:uncharacterized protein YbjT (DUF2867 family)
MFAIVGAAGKIGYSTSKALRQAGFSVRAILRDKAKAHPLSEIGCEVAIADIQDSRSLATAIGDAQAVQVICPPMPHAQDAVADMRRSIEGLYEALEQTRPGLVLAISDYGAHVGEDIGMPTVFRLFEQRLRQLEITKVFLRSAEHIEGWAPLIPVAVQAGVLPSFHHPVEKKFPTVSAHDVGRIAADLLIKPNVGAGEQVVHAEGPSRYSAADVAAALSRLLERSVVAQAVPRSQWAESLERVVSVSTADLLAKLYDAHNLGGVVDVEAGVGEIRYGTTDLIDALRPLLPAR